MCHLSYSTFLKRQSLLHWMKTVDILNKLFLPNPVVLIPIWYNRMDLNHVSCGMERKSCEGKTSTVGVKGVRPWITGRKLGGQTSLRQTWRTQVMAIFKKYKKPGENKNKSGYNSGTLEPDWESRLRLPLGQPPPAKTCLGASPQVPWTPSEQSKEGGNEATGTPGIP